MIQESCKPAGVLAYTLQLIKTILWMQMNDVQYRNDPAMALKVEQNLRMSLNFKLSQKLLASITTREPSGMEFKWTFIKVEN